MVDPMVNMAASASSVAVLGGSPTISTRMRTSAVFAGAVEDRVRRVHCDVGAETLGELNDPSDVPVLLR